MARISFTLEVVIFLWNFVSHWQVYATGGAVIGLVGLWNAFLARASQSGLLSGSL
jgi:hypothetical protein